MAKVVEVNLVAKTDDAVAGVNKVDQAVKKTAKTTKKASKELSGMQQIGGAVLGKLDQMTGGLASKLVAVGSAAKLSGKAMKTALISSGIGAAVVAVGLLVEHWDAISEALGFINKDLEKQLELNNENVGVIDSQLSLLQKEIEFNKKRGISNVENLKQQKQLFEAKKTLLKTNIKILETQILQEKSSARELSFTEDITASALQGLGFYKEAAEIRAKGYATDLDEQKKINKLLADLNKLKSDSLELDLTIDPPAEDVKDDTEVETKKRSLEQIKKLEADYALSLMSEENQEKIAVAAKYDDLIAQAEKYNVDTFALVEARETEIKAIEKKYEDQAKEKRAEERATSMEAFNERNDDRLKRIEENAKRELEIQQDLADAEANILNAKLNFASSGVELLGQLAGENKALSAGLLVVEKGLAIADVIINASRSIAAAKANLAATPAVIGTFPNPMYAVQAATTAKGILATKLSAAASIATITAQAIPGLSGGGGGGSTSVGGGGGDTGSQAPAFNIVGASGETQLADAIGSQTQRPSRAYVVSNDVTTAQEMDRNIIEGASIG